jgi:hypothetical protein
MFDTHAVYYGVKKAVEPVHADEPSDYGVVVVNTSRGRVWGCSRIG